MSFLAEVHGLTSEWKGRLREATRRCGENHIWFSVDLDGFCVVGCFDAGRPVRLVEGWYWSECLDRLNRLAAGQRLPETGR